MTLKQQALVDTGNTLSDFALELIKKVDSANRYFTVENPDLSWLWWQPDWIAFKEKRGVIATRLQQKLYGWV